MLFEAAPNMIDPAPNFSNLGQSACPALVETTPSSVGIFLEPPIVSDNGLGRGPPGPAGGKDEPVEEGLVICTQIRTLCDMLKESLNGRICRAVFP